MADGQVSYDLLTGFTFITTLVILLGISIILGMSITLYRCLESQDIAISQKNDQIVVEKIARSLKSLLLAVLGYRGENREKTPISEIDEKWIFKYKYSTILRFIPIYSIYIVTLVILGKPVEIVEGSVRVINYIYDVQSLYLILVGYVLSNVFFDFISLSFTFKHVTNAVKTGKYSLYFLKDIAIASVLFLFSQIISCWFWLEKVRDSQSPSFDGNIVETFFEISLWPYAFVTNMETHSIIGPLIPGQLLITGTVYFPTVVIALILISFSSFIWISKRIKLALSNAKLEYICTKYLRIRPETVFIPSEKIADYGSCNLVLMLFFSSFHGVFLICLANSVISVFK